MSKKKTDTKNVSKKNNKNDYSDDQLFRIPLKNGLDATLIIQDFNSSNRGFSLVNLNTPTGTTQFLTMHFIPTLNVVMNLYNSGIVGSEYNIHCTGLVKRDTNDQSTSKVHYWSAFRGIGVRKLSKKIPKYSENYCTKASVNDLFILDELDYSDRIIKKYRLDFSDVSKILKVFWKLLPAFSFMEHTQSHHDGDFDIIEFGILDHYLSKKEVDKVYHCFSKVNQPDIDFTDSILMKEPFLKDSGGIFFDIEGFHDQI